MPVQERDLGDSCDIDVSTLSDEQFSGLLAELSQDRSAAVRDSIARLRTPVSDLRQPEELAPSPFAQVKPLIY